MAYCKPSAREEDLLKHQAMARVHDNRCEVHEKRFNTFVGLKEHWVQSPHHHYCQYCNKHFDAAEDHVVHNDDFHHWCPGRFCKRIFKSGHGLDEHLLQSRAHHWCELCKKSFKWPYDLDQHLANAAVHSRNRFQSYRSYSSDSSY